MGTTPGDVVPALPTAGFARSVERLSASFEPAAGVLINDNLELVRSIAEGGMGSVWLARHIGLDLPVAIKFMSPALFRDEPEAVERFTREARAAAQIRHPNVIRILDFRFQSIEGEAPYIVMELLEGEDLERYIRRRGRLDVREVASIVTAVAGVLDKAHEHGIVHRDIKPENIFLEGPERTVKVLDFGVAKDERELEKYVREEEGMMFGTPYFMSPEQFANAREVDGRCDLWALAVVAYEALTGRMPFGGATLSAIFLAAVRGQFKPPSQLREELGPAIDAWFQKVFAVRLEDRFSSAREMGDAFARAAFVPSADGEMLGTLRQFADLSAWRANRWRRSTAISFALVAGAVISFGVVGRLPPLESAPAKPPLADAVPSSDRWRGSNADGESRYTRHESAPPPLAAERMAALPLPSCAIPRPATLGAPPVAMQRKGLGAGAARGKLAPAPADPAEDTYGEVESEEDSAFAERPTFDSPVPATQVHSDGANEDARSDKPSPSL